MAKDLRETRIDSEVVFKGGFLEVRRDRVRLPDGRPTRREFVVHPGAAAMLPIFPDERILVERQFRYPVGATFVEVPAGKLDPGESALQTARRELVEETGWSAGRVEVLLTGPTSSGMSNERIAFVRARELVRVGEGGGVDDEDIIVHAVPRNEAPAWLMRKRAEGYELDLKLWAGLWMIDHNPDGSPAS